MGFLKQSSFSHGVSLYGLEGILWISGRQNLKMFLRKHISVMIVAQTVCSSVTNAVIGGAGMVGYSFAFVADFNKAMVAAARVFQLLDRQPLIDTNPATGLKLAEVEGNVAIKDAEFSYPTRPSTQILNKLQLSIKNGESIALVGESGCGKSTVIQVIITRETLIR